MQDWRRFCAESLQTPREGCGWLAHGCMGMPTCLLVLRWGALFAAVGVDPSEWGTGEACLTCSCVMQWMDLARRMLCAAAWVAACLPPTMPCCVTP